MSTDTSTRTIGMDNAVALSVLYTIICTFLIVAVRVYIVIRTIKSNRRRVKEQQSSSSSSSSNSSSSGLIRNIDQPLPTLIVLGSGGHTTEILYMTQQINSLCKPNDTAAATTGVSTPAPVLFDPIDYCQASTDTTSKDRLYQMMKASSSSSSSSAHINNSIKIYNIPRSREVGQSYFSSIYTTLVALIYSMKLVYKLQPNVILCNGPGTCIPICMITFLYRICNILSNHQTYIIFIESFCRVQTLSLSGKILYPIADIFIVHWEELYRLYPNTILTDTYMKQ